MSIRTKVLFLIFVCAVGAAVFFWFLFPQLSRPITGWGTLTWDMALRAAAGHPSSADYAFDFPFYACVIAVFFRFFGVSEISARLAGAGSFLLMPVLLYVLVQQLAPARLHLRAAVIAVVLFVVSPAAQQGAVLIDKADTHLFVCAITLFYLFFLKAHDLRRLPWIAAAAGMYALCLCLKIVPAAACMLSIPFVYAARKELPSGMRVFLPVLAGGTAIFLLVWFGYCCAAGTIRDFGRPFGFYLHALAGNGYMPLPAFFAKTALDMARILAWFSPLVMILFCMAVVSTARGRRANIRESQLLSYISVICAGYLYSNASFGGFPKYVLPAFPMICALTAVYIARRTEPLFTRGRAVFVLAIIAAGALYYYTAAGDWLYPVYTLRQAQVGGDIYEALMGYIGKVFRYGFFPLLALMVMGGMRRISPAQRIVAALCVSLAASSAALMLIQRRADYSLNYAYGTDGHAGVRLFCRRNPGITVYSSIEGFFANTGTASFKAVPVRAWNNPRALRQFLEERGPDYLLTGLGANTASQMRMLWDSGLEEYVNSNYRSLYIGSYRMLVRKGVTYQL